MLGYKLLLKLFGFTAKHGLIDPISLMSYRKLNSDFQRAIDNNYSDFRNLHRTYNRIKDVLVYDMSEYDNQFYKRQLLQKLLRKNYQQYRDLEMPTVDVFTDPDLGDQYIVNKHKFPDSYYLFLSLYSEFPSTRIKLYSINTMQEIVNTQHEDLQTLILNMQTESELDNVIMFHPICYVKHFKQTPDDEQFIMLMCFVNVVDTLIDNDFPFTNERYCNLKLSLDNLEDSDEHFDKLQDLLYDRTNAIKKGTETMLLPRNIATQLGSFEEMFNELIDNQEFNI